MSAKLRSKNHDRIPQAKLDALIIDKKDSDVEQTVFVQRDRVDPKPILHSDEQYDDMRPEETLKLFCASVRDMIRRYESDHEKLTKLENEMQDLLHYMEMGKDKNARDGFKLYRRLCEVRRERRTCKNEIILLQPVYNTFHGTKILDILSQTQGECRAVKQAIDNKGYIVRTDILKDFFE